MGRTSGSAANTWFPRVDQDLFATELQVKKILLLIIPVCQIVSATQLHLYSMGVLPQTRRRAASNSFFMNEWGMEANLHDWRRKSPWKLTFSVSAMSNSRFSREGIA